MSEVTTQVDKDEALELKVADLWERDADELRRHAAALRERANRKESESLAGLSLNDAALSIVLVRDKPPSYFDLFSVLRYGQAADMNVVQFYYAMRRSPVVRMNGIHVVRRRVRAGVEFESQHSK